MKKLPSCRSIKDQISQLVQQTNEWQTWGGNRSLDVFHALQLKSIVNSIGWPRSSTVGINQGTIHEIWLTVQHSDHDPNFQMRCLNAMWESGSPDLPAMAFLHDRILVNIGERQIYGTQLFLDQEKLSPRPIQSYSQLDGLRRKMGLGPFEDYLGVMNASAP